MYALGILKETCIMCRSMDSPMETNQKLMTEQGESFFDSERYRRLVWKLIYLTISIPDLVLVCSCGLLVLAIGMISFVS